MARVSTFLLFVLTFFCTTFSFAQEEVVPAHAIGKRVELTVKYKNEDGDFKCVGTVVQVDRNRLILENVFKTEVVNRGVPFLSNIKNHDKLFTNVGAFKTVELEFDIVLPLARIKSCRIAEPKGVKEVNATAPKLLGSSSLNFNGINESAKSIRRFTERKIWR